MLHINHWTAQTNAPNVHIYKHFKLNIVGLMIFKWFESPTFTELSLLIRGLKLEGSRLNVIWSDSKNLFIPVSNDCGLWKRRKKRHSCTNSNKNFQFTLGKDGEVFYMYFSFLSKTAFPLWLFIKFILWIQLYITFPYMSLWNLHNISTLSLVHISLNLGLTS